jgi:hypothetical protein
MVYGPSSHWDGRNERRYSSSAGEVLRGQARRRAQCEGGALVGAGRPTDAEVDAAGMQRGEHPELLRHDERSMVRQHHATGTDPDRRRRRRKMRDQHRR